jgi:hypothetical protein
MRRKDLSALDDVYLAERLTIIANLHEMIFGRKQSGTERTCRTKEIHREIEGDHTRYAGFFSDRCDDTRPSFADGLREFGKRWRRRRDHVDGRAGCGWGGDHLRHYRRLGVQGEERRSWHFRRTLPALFRRRAR